MALVLIAHFVLAFLFVMVAMGAVIAYEQESDEVARPLATLIGGVSLGLSGATWLAALLLGTSEPLYRPSVAPTNIAYAGAQTGAQTGTQSGMRGFFWEFIVSSFSHMALPC